MSLAVASTRLAPVELRDAGVRRLESRDAEKLKAMKAAVAVVKSQPQEAAAARKAAARAKVEQIRERIRLLAVSAGIDPRATARQAAQLARELGQAVKDYVAAGGKEKLASSVAVPAQASGVMEETTPANDGRTADDPDAAAADAETDTPPAAASASLDPYRKTLSSLQDQGRDLRALREAQDTDGRQNKDFLDQVRGLARKLKDILLESRLKNPQGRDARLDEEADVEIKAMDAEISQATRSLNTFTGASVSA
ncbi:hypothetical protein [Brevundimonas variabilis]|uniref:Uncharacterized protein n=1 Tax=Brevundimonas variabilis TaxID=74312 RepID=A0A7W9CGM8_9CAUL|nr:hypothetical protein [Brevundimonas variabilis]MBB5745298.1 hypothetical protein [Brevundimonas variabilis]